MDLSTLANLINAFAVTAGVVFAAVQIRYYRRQRQREAMLELVKSFQSPAFTNALCRVLSLSDDADAKNIYEVLGPEVAFCERRRCKGNSKITPHPPTCYSSLFSA